MFIYNQWNDFCNKLQNDGIISVSAASILKKKYDTPFLVLKHDVETNPKKALKLAKIESKFGHKGSYYIQAYLLNKRKNISILKQIQSLGHEVSYHYDVMDNNKGNLSKAKEEFIRNVELFEKNGFKIETVCQHGNPVIERYGYTSNRDFFRDNDMMNSFNQIFDIMVNFKSEINENYKYISDAGYGWNIIYDPENNDIIDSSSQNIKLNNLTDVLNIFKSQNSIIISTHTHRWNGSPIFANFKIVGFRIIKGITRIMIKNHFIKKIIGRYYYLAKKI